MTTKPETETDTTEARRVRMEVHASRIAAFIAAGDELALTRARLTAEQQGEMTRDLARAFALVLTKIDEATMWLERAHQEELTAVYGPPNRRER